jgi:hypothetical protein
MLPTNSFDGRRRIINCGRLVPIHAGILPDSLFSPKSITLSEEQFINDTGNSPMKLLFWKCNDVRELYFQQIFPKDLGILPERLLFAKLRCSDSPFLANTWRSSPNNKLFERSRCCKDPSDSHMNVIVPWNLRFGICPVTISLEARDG